jgi:hypothetical protein
MYITGPSSGTNGMEIKPHDTSQVLNYTKKMQQKGIEDL